MGLQQDQNTFWGNGKPNSHFSLAHLMNLMKYENNSQTVSDVGNGHTLTRSVFFSFIFVLLDSFLVSF